MPKAKVKKISDYIQKSIHFFFFENVKPSINDPATPKEIQQWRRKMDGFFSSFACLLRLINLALCSLDVNWFTAVVMYDNVRRWGALDVGINVMEDPSDLPAPLPPQWLMYHSVYHRSGWLELSKEHFGKAKVKLCFFPLPQRSYSRSSFYVIFDTIGHFY